MANPEYVADLQRITREAIRQAQQDPLLLEAGLILRAECAPKGYAIFYVYDPDTEHPAIDIIYNGKNERLNIAEYGVTFENINKGRLEALAQKVDSLVITNDKGRSYSTVGGEKINRQFKVPELTAEIPSGRYPHTD